MFDGFERTRIEVNGLEMAVVTGGQGPPLYLLHGFPQTHVAWHRVAPRSTGPLAGRAGSTTGRPWPVWSADRVPGRAEGLRRQPVDPRALRRSQRRSRWSVSDSDSRRASGSSADSGRRPV